MTAVSHYSGEAMVASGLLEIEDAQRLVLSAVSPLGCEAVELSAALGRVLAQDVAAVEAVPAFDGSAMDGFAVRAEDILGAGPATPVRLVVVDESRAGCPARDELHAGEAIAISTGAMLPAGADTIVRIEDARQQDDRVEVLLAAPAGRHVRRAGEDIRAGETVLRRGTALRAAELGVLASLGLGQVRCALRPRLSVLVSGDELLSADQPMRPGGVRDSNSLSVSALARDAGAEVLRCAVVADEAQATTAAVAAAVEDVDVAIICGGVSVGVHDHVRPALAALGADRVFWGVALKPGRPTWFGTLGGTLVFGLPGNPVSAMVTFALLVAPALRALQSLEAKSPRLTAVMDCDYGKPVGRAHAVRCRVSAHDDGWHVEPTGADGSHVLTSMLGADALAIVPPQAVGVTAGERVEIVPLRSWIGAPA
jgi:molybdopterin molybdotransferase